MNFLPTKLRGVLLIQMKPVDSELGYLSRSYCETMFRDMDCETVWPQCNEVLNIQAGTIRGMHWQSGAFAEAKLVRCLRGRIIDVIVDVRPDSETFGKFEMLELSAEKLNQVYIPKGFAHGYQTLEDNCLLHYQMSAEYNSAAATGFRWNDPAVGIPWPLEVTLLSKKDANLPNLSR